jgi:hypothetical protein
MISNILFSTGEKLSPVDFSFLSRNKPSLGIVDKFYLIFQFGTECDRLDFIRQNQYAS